MSRGVVFITDSVIATGIMAVMLTASLYYIMDSQKSRWTDVSLIKTAYDMGITLDQSGVIAGKNETEINATFYALTPDNMVAHMRVDRYHYINNSLSLVQSTEYGSEIEGDKMEQRLISSDGRNGFYKMDLTVRLK